MNIWASAAADRSRRLSQREREREKAVGTACAAKDLFPAAAGRRRLKEIAERRFCLSRCGLELNPTEQHQAATATPEAPPPGREGKFCKRSSVDAVWVI